jgi:hypothetical protein
VEDGAGKATEASASCHGMTVAVCWNAQEHPTAAVRASSGQDVLEKFDGHIVLAG